MINKQQIEELREKKKIPKMEFYEKIGMTSKGYVQMFENNSMKISTLEKIADILEVPISLFFAETKKRLTAEDLQDRINDLYDDNKQLANENRALMKENGFLKDKIHQLEKNSTLPENVPISKLKEKH